MKLSYLNIPTITKYLSEKKEAKHSENPQRAAEIDRVKASTAKSQNEIGGNAGYSKGGISLIRSGDRNPSAAGMKGLERAGIKVNINRLKVKPRKPK